MNIWEQFENQRDMLYCGGYDAPEEWQEAEIGAEYEMWDNMYDEVLETVICTAENRDEIEKSLNDRQNDIWWWRKTRKEA